MSGEQQTDRRGFLADGARVVGVVSAGVLGGYLAGQRGQAEENRWQIDPDKCVGCGNCATHCVLDESAVKCVQCFDMCGFCNRCTGYYTLDGLDSRDTAAEDLLCPTEAIIRTFVEGKAGQNFYEYTIDTDACIGCAMCVKGCALMNGSLYLQVMHDRCVNCNECAIAVACPSDAFVNVSADKPYRLKRIALGVMRQKAGKSDTAAQKLLGQVHADE
ncbi:4Fe-4S binding protein [Rhodopirellula sp. JC639]|uniref:4Fe-4S binding protein n=1 Tax=Stieleria mannarensis TaxID=2755585 RepID=UPI00256FE6E5|nr:4Fe-4S binding protein [Rhodopirellula sp. JC639]